MLTFKNNISQIVTILIYLTKAVNLVSLLCNILIIQMVLFTNCFVIRINYTGDNITWIPIVLILIFLILSVINIFFIKNIPFSVFCNFLCGTSIFYFFGYILKLVKDNIYDDGSIIRNMLYTVYYYYPFSEKKSWVAQLENEIPIKFQVDDATLINHHSYQSLKNTILKKIAENKEDITKKITETTTESSGIWSKICEHKIAIGVTLGVCLICGGLIYFYLSKGLSAEILKEQNKNIQINAENSASQATLAAQNRLEVTANEVIYQNFVQQTRIEINAQNVKIDHALDRINILNNTVEEMKTKINDIGALANDIGDKISEISTSLQESTSHVITNITYRNELINDISQRTINKFHIMLQEYYTQVISVKNSVMDFKDTASVMDKNIRTVFTGHEMRLAALENSDAATKQFAELAAATIM